MSYSSVIIYLTVFALSVAFTKLAEMQLAPVNFENGQAALRRDKLYASRICFWAFSAAAITLPCLLAAFRSTNVGTDVSGYLLTNWQIASFHSRSFMDFYKVSNGIEIGFAWLMYICAKYFNLHVLFFLIELLTILPTYISLYMYKNQLTMTAGMTAFLFLFYNFSLSGMRQSIAMGFVFLSFCLFCRHSYLKAALSAAAAFLFHSSSILIVAIILIVSLFAKSQYRKQWYLALSAVLMIVFIFYRNIALILSKIVSVLSPRYSFYITYYLNSSFRWEDVQATDLLSKSFIILIAVCSLLYVHKRRSAPMLVSNLTVICLLGRYFALFNANFYESMRIAFYFDFFLTMYIPIIRQKYFSTNKMTQLIFDCLMLVPLLLYWVYFIMHIGAYGTNRFTFSI